MKKSFSSGVLYSGLLSALVCGWRIRSCERVLAQGLVGLVVTLIF